MVPADIQREAAALAAAGAAAPTAENGRATAESLGLVAYAWTKAGPSAQDMFLINKIEDITQIVVDAVQRIKLGGAPDRWWRRAGPAPLRRGLPGCRGRGAALAVCHHG